MEELLKKELFLTREFYNDPSETNRMELLNVKKEMIMLFNKSENNINVCKNYINKQNEKLLAQYNEFSNLFEYLKDKEDVTNITKILNELRDQLL
uniref:Uncharacterized protein n=1 Tax=viral metagenome TaxID=1070528 RepID=A0A6C0HSC3_9ZZZZ